MFLPLVDHWEMGGIGEMIDASFSLRLRWVGQPPHSETGISSLMCDIRRGEWSDQAAVETGPPHGSLPVLLRPVEILIGVQEFRFAFLPDQEG